MIQVIRTYNEGQSRWNQPIFAELPLANRNDALIKIDVSNA